MNAETDIQRRYSEYLLEKRNLSQKIKPKNIWKPYGSWFNARYNLKNKNILDIGCLIESEIYKKFKKDNNSTDVGYHGFDIDNESIDWLKSISAYFDLYSEESSELFDYIFLIDVYEHLTPDEKMQILSISRKLLRPNGEMYVAFPYMENLNYFVNGIGDWTHKYVSLKSGSEPAAFISFGGFKFGDLEIYLAGLTMPWLTKWDNVKAIVRNLICLYPPFHVAVIIGTKRI